MLVFKNSTNVKVHSFRIFVRFTLDYLQQDSLKLRDDAEVQ